MLLWLSHYLLQFNTGFYVFNYLTLRGILSVVTALFISLWLGPIVIRWLQSKQMGQPVRAEGPESHLQKAGTPTMGGLMIIIAISLSTLLWADLSNHYVWITLLVMWLFAAIGWFDDYQKLRQKHSRGLKSRWKYCLQSISALFVLTLIYAFAEAPSETTIFVPFFKDMIIPLGALYILWGYFVIVGTSNAVNLTDGLDGLAIMPTVMIAGGLGVFAYVSGHAVFADYLTIPYLPHAGELIIICAAILGSGLGFLWFNSYPAQVFMGDIGSLSLGAVLGTIAMLVRQELVLVIMGGVFVMETVSVMLQVASFKLTGRRIFNMAPLHHHYELKGWPEPKVIVRFWIISFILVLVGLATLKIR